MICPNCGKELQELCVYGLRFTPKCCCQEEAEAKAQEDETLRGMDNLTAAYLRLSGVSKRYAKADIHNIQPRAGQEDAHAACMAMADVRPEGSGLLLIGGVGSGKTMLASGTVNRRLRSQARLASDEFKRTFSRVTNTLDYLLHPSAMMVGTVDLIAQLKACFDGRGDAEAVMAKYKTVPLLALDDLGAELATEWTTEKLFELIDSRYNACLPMIVTTNCIPDEMGKRLGTRTADRLREMCRIINITAGSQRPTAGKGE